jgi:SAM-dependent methyltransferase
MPFKDHFSGHATAYREARPTYPAALFDWLASEAPARELAWDAGCGNGQASVALASRFARVFATDPSATQIGNAELRPNVEYRVEPGEQCSLPPQSADLVTVAQALHWFDFARFFAEAGRVLKPRGLLAAWAYSDCRVTPEVDALKNRVYVDLTGPYWPPERDHVDAGYRTIPFPFEDRNGTAAPFEEIAAPAFVMSAEWNAAQFLAYLRSWSATQRYIKANGTDPVAVVERDLLAAWGDPETPREVRCAALLRDMGRLDEARSEFEAIIAAERRIFDRPHQKIAIALGHLARTEAALGHADVAAARWGEAADVMRAAAGPDHPYLAQIRLNHARALGAIGQWAAAEPILRELLAAGGGESRPAPDAVRLELASALLARGDTEGADELVRAVLGADPKPPLRERALVLQSQLAAAIDAR